MSGKKVSTIVDRYSFNVPKFETSVSTVVSRGGNCNRPCSGCINKISGRCSECNINDKATCPDRECKGDECERCVVLCSRGGGRLREAIEYIGGLEIDTKRRMQNSAELPKTGRITVASTKGFFTESDVIVSIPWYAIYDFINDQIVSTDIRDFFKISPETKVIINSYMKDDKVMVLFEKMLDNSFFSIVNSYSGVDFWHTPCFSVFDKSSSMDQLLNFKRQFWAGDIMRDAGMNVIQEILFTISDCHKVHAGPDEVIDIVKRKRIRILSLCGQLQRGKPESGNIDFFRSIPSACTLIGIGFPPVWRDCINNNCKCHVVHGDYRKQYAKRR